MQHIPPFEPTLRHNVIPGLISIPPFWITGHDQRAMRQRPMRLVASLPDMQGAGVTERVFAGDPIVLFCWIRAVGWHRRKLARQDADYVCGHEALLVVDQSAVTVRAGIAWWTVCAVKVRAM